MIVVVVLLAFVSEASAQGGKPQRESLLRLGGTSNNTLVEHMQCNTNNTSTDLICNFTDSEELIVNCNTGVALQMVKFQICLCDSAMTVAYTLTNGSMVTRKCNQCPVPVQIDRLLLENVFDVYLDGNGITRIAVLVKLSANDPDNPVTVFNNTVSLNQQAMDCEGTVAPPSSCNSSTTATVPTTTATSRLCPTPQPSMRSKFNKIYIPIICVVLAVPVVIIIIVALAYAIYRKKCYRKQNVYDMGPINGEKSKLNGDSKERIN